MTKKNFAYAFRLFIKHVGLLFKFFPIATSFRGHNTSVYGHRQGESETYIQPRGMMRPPIGRPNERDVSSAMDTKDLHRLAKQLNHAIL